ncbi:MAG: SPOR domain-containing protein [Treponema sp.]|nr:SPOR domain-containing protein [Treponema sp.]
MEKKKLLLVAISVGVFLALVISAALLIFPAGQGAAFSKTREPRLIAAGTAGTRGLPVVPKTPSGAVEGIGLLPEVSLEGLPAEPASVDAVELARGRGGIQGIKPPPADKALPSDEFLITGESVAGATADADTGAGATTVAPAVAPAPPAPAAKPAASPVVIDVPAPKAAAVPDLTVKSAPAAKAPASAPAPAAKKPAAHTAAAAPKKSPAQAKAESSLAENYWVQAGSFSAQSHAEAVKETLKTKGISSIIENRDVNGAARFRVRIGPYTSRSEADYWLSLIKEIKGFEGSQVWKNN